MQKTEVYELDLHGRKLAQIQNIERVKVIIIVGVVMRLVYYCSFFAVQEPEGIGSLL